MNSNGNVDLYGEADRLCNQMYQAMNIAVDVSGLAVESFDKQYFAGEITSNYHFQYAMQELRNVVVDLRSELFSGGVEVELFVGILLAELNDIIVAEQDNMLPEHSIGGVVN